jgi:hypothetical protein
MVSSNVKNNALERLIQSGDRAGVRAVLLDMSEHERANFSRLAISWYEKSSQMKWPVNNMFTGWHGTHVLGRDCFAASLNTCLATSNAQQLSKLTYTTMSADDLDFELLGKLQPSALRDFGNTLIEQDRNHYESIRKLIQHGLCEIPTCDSYVLAMISSNEGWGWRQDQWRAVSVRFLEEPDMQQNIWRIFEVQNQELSTLSPKKSAVNPPPETWCDALVKLSQTGHLDRQRLLLSTIEALGRDFRTHHARWFTELHDALQPTEEEVFALVDYYIPHLNSANASTAKWVLQKLNKATKKRPLPPERFAKSMRPFLHSAVKTTVLFAVQLLDQAAKNFPDFATEACEIAAEGLLHESAEVQDRVIKVFENHAYAMTSDLADVIASKRAYLSHSSAKKLEQLIAGSSPAANQNLTPTRYVFIQPAQFQVDFEQQAAIKRICSIDELLHVAAYCLEHSEDSLELERMLDGFSRLTISNFPELSSRFAPLQQLTNSVMRSNSWRSSVLPYPLGAFVRDCYRAAEAHLSGAKFIPSRETRAAQDSADGALADQASYVFLTSRLREVVDRLALGIELPVVSFPSHSDGWLHPAVLTERLNQYESRGTKMGSFDLCVALLRLPLGNIRDRYPQLIENQGEFWDAMRYAVGTCDRLTKSASPVWLAANTFRSPPEFGRLVDLGTGRLFGWLPSYSVTRWQSLMFPSIRELLLSAGVSRVADAISNCDSSNLQDRVFLELLCHGDFPAGKSSARLIGAGCYVGDPEFAGFARDAMIRAIERQELDVQALGQSVCRLLYSEFGRPKRLSNVLAQVASVSSLHASAVRQVLEHSLHGGRLVPKGLSSVLELFHELLIAEGACVKDEATIAHLQSIKTGAQTGKLIKAILKL